MNVALKKTVLAKSRSAEDSLEAETLSLEANYLYVRFLANGKQGERELKSYDSTLVLFKHPMDYKQISKPAVYIDPTLPDSVIPYFATVPVDYKFGPTKYEVIKKLFLVEPDECGGDDCDDIDNDSTTVEKRLLSRTKGLTKKSASKLSDLGVSLREVEWNSLEMTGNLNERLSSDGVKTFNKPKFAWSLFSSARKMGGKLMYRDTTLNKDLPLVGVRVTGGYSYYWREAHTKEDGSFSIPEKWSYSIDYEANFDSEDFLLENGHSFYGEDLEIEKNSTKQQWTPIFEGKHALWSIIWSAAYQYWYGDNYGLKRPRQNTLTNLSLDIEVYYKNKKDYTKAFSIFTDNPGFGCNAGNRTVGQTGTAIVFDNICILAYERSHHEVFGTTIHEIAHSSQYWNMKTDYALYPQVAEYNWVLTPTYKDSYARGVQNYFIEQRYNSTAYNAPYDLQYTGIVKDLMDNNPKVEWSCTKLDRVSGFNIVNIEEAFFQNQDFSSMKKYLIKNNPPGKNGVNKYSSTDMDNLFKCWGL